MLRIDVWTDAFVIDLCAAVALRSAARHLRWQFAACVPHGVLPAVECLMTPKAGNLVSLARCYWTAASQFNRGSRKRTFCCTKMGRRCAPSENLGSPAPKKGEQLSLLPQMSGKGSSSV